MMYFQQVDEIAQELKHCTQRVQKDDDVSVTNDAGAIAAVMNGARRKWVVGNIYSVTPGRGKLTALVCFDYTPPLVVQPHRWFDDMVYRHDGMIPLQIRITEIESVRLQSMNTVIAKAEGVTSRQAYKKLWESINGKTKGSRWDDNPMVWRLWFAVVK
jgi:hypothetical protein